MPDYQRFIDASDRTAEYFVSHLSEEGEILADGVEKDPAFYYKLPAMMFNAGKEKQAKNVLAYIQKTFVTSAGDLRAGVDLKTRNGALADHAAYMNGWVAVAAISMQNQSLQEQLYNFASKQKCTSPPITGGWRTNTAGEVLDFMTTSHYGRIALLRKDVETAKAAADFLKNAVERQPRSDILYIRVGQDGRPVTAFPQDMASFYEIQAKDPNQLYFFAGYPAAFLAMAYSETKDESYLTAAKTILDFCLTCDASIYKFHFAHKVAWAASIVAAITKEEKYVQLAVRISEFLVSLCSEEGLFLSDEDPIDTFDQSAELAMWLREIAQNLSAV